MRKTLVVLSALFVSSMVVAAEGPSPLSASSSMGETLKQMAGSKARVELVLDNGKVYGGMVKEVGNGNVLLTQLSQKEFYDALIKIEDISAIETRAR